MSTYYDEPTPSSDPLSNPRVITAIVLAVAGLVALIGCIGIYFFLGGGNRGAGGQGTLVVNVTGIPTLTPTLTPIPSLTPEPTLEDGTGGGGEGEPTPDLTLTFAALPAIRTANLTDLQGLIQIRSSPDAGFVTIMEDVAIQGGTGVLTSENSSARMTTTEGGVNRVSSQTQYTLTEFAGTAANPVTKLTLDFGKVWSIVNNPLGTGKFEVDTPLGLASMLQPSYMSVEHNSTEELVILTCLYGKCRFANDSGVQDLVTGQQLVIRRGVPLSGTTPTNIDPGQLSDWATQMPETGSLTPSPTLTATETITRTPTLTRTPRDTPNVEQTSNAAASRTSLALTQAQFSQNQTSTQNSANLTSTVFFFNVTATALFQSTMNSFTATSFSFTATSFGATSAANATNSSFTQTAAVNGTNANLATATWVSTIATATAVAQNATNTQAAIITQTASVPIVNFDPGSYFPSVPESDGDVTLTVRVSNAVPVNIDLTASMVDVSATGGGTLPSFPPVACSGVVDYDNDPVNFFIPANQLSTTIDIPISDDGCAEGNQTFQVNLACNGACDGGSSMGPNSISTVTIVNSGQRSVGFTSGGFGFSEGDSGTTNANLTVSLNPSPGYANVNTVNVTYTILGSGTATGTATCDDVTDPAKDYDNNSITDDDSTSGDGILTFAPGDVMRTINIPICGDTPDEPDETINLTLAVTSGNATLGTATVALTIQDNDVAPAITIAPGSANATEPLNFGTAIVPFTVNLSAQSGQTITVNYATVAGSASQGTDYQGASGVITFLPGDTSEPLNITLFGDQLHESPETFSVDLTGPANATLGSPAVSVFTIDDDGDAAPAVFYSAVPYEMFEGDGGTTSVSITVNLSRLSGQEIVLVYNTLDGANLADCNGIASANAGSDYAPSSGTLTFTAGVDLSRQFTVNVNGDTTIEGTECLRLTLTVGNGDVAGSGNVLNSALVIKNDDP